MDRLQTGVEIADRDREPRKTGVACWDGLVVYGCFYRRTEIEVSALRSYVSRRRVIDFYLIYKARRSRPTPHICLWQQLEEEEVTAAWGCRCARAYVVVRQRCSETPE